MMIMFGDGRLVIGLTSGNFDQLLALKPATQLMPFPVKFEKVLIIYGRDKPHIMEQLEAAGVEFAEAMKQSAREDPL